MGTKQVISSARQRACALVISGQAHCDAFGAFIPGLVTARLFPASATEMCSERTKILERRGSHSKNDEMNDTSIE
jgi:hypothetical protein